MGGRAAMAEAKARRTLQAIRPTGLARTAAILWLGYACLLEGRAASAQKLQSDAITPLLETRLKTGGNLGDVIVDIGWPFQARHPVCRLYGDGVGIWDRQVQFRLSRAQVTSLLQALVRDRFGSLPDIVGGDEKRKKRQKGQVKVSIGTVTKTVVQLEGGNQSQELQSIAQQFLRASATAAAAGVRVSSFADGFDKLAAGRLAAQALVIIVEPKTRAPRDQTQERWALRLDGRRASVRAMRGPEVQGTPTDLTLSKADFEALLRPLRDANLETLPRKLYAAQYTDVRIQVLNQVCVIQAGPFPGLTPRTHGAEQQSFDRITDALLALQARVEKGGVPPAGETGTARRPTPGG
jgi:hypothetical protein